MLRIYVALALHSIVLLITSSASAGPVSFSIGFSNFRGPSGVEISGTPIPYYVNYSQIPTNPSLGTWTDPLQSQVVYSRGNTSISGVNCATPSGSGSCVTFGDVSTEPVSGTSAFERLNIVSFTPSVGTDVEVGELFSLGTLGFQNGSWSPDPFNTFLDFSILSSSATPELDGQVFSGQLEIVSNRQVAGDPDAGADWLYIIEAPFAGSLRVYERFDMPFGFTNVGYAEIWGYFGSLHVDSLRNPDGGFLSPVPEPGSLGILVLALTLLGLIRHRG